MENVYSDYFEGGAIRYKPRVKSLQHQASVKISIPLWKIHLSQKISDIFELDDHVEQKLYCKKMFPFIQEYVKTILLPLSRIRVFIRLMQQMAVDIFKWIKFQKENFRIRDPWNYINIITWDSKGRIDERRTAKALNLGDAGEFSKYYWPENDQDLGFCHLFENLSLVDPRENFEIFYKENVEISFSFDWECLGYHRSSKYVLLKIWNLLDENRKLSLLATRIDSGRNATDVFCFLLSQMTFEQQVEAFRGEPEYLLVNIYSDPCWRDHLIPTLLHFFAYTNARTLVALFHLITMELHCDIEVAENKSLFMTMLQNIPPNLKNDLLADDWGSKSFFMEGIFTLLFEMDHKEIYEKSLTCFFETDRCLKNFFLSYDKSYYLNLRFIFSTVNFNKAEELMVRFIQDEDQIVKCKNFFLTEGRHYVSDLWAEGSFERLDGVLSFCLCNDNEAINKFKRDYFFQDTTEENYEYVDTYFAFIMMRNDNFKLLDKLFIWIVGDQEEVTSFKAQVFTVHKRIVNICLDLLQGKEKLAPSQLDRFLEWCLPTKECALKFKKDLFQNLTLRGFNNTFYIIAFWETREVPHKLIRWLNPSLQSITEGRMRYNKNRPLNKFDEDLYDILVSKEIELISQL